MKYAAILAMLILAGCQKVEPTPSPPADTAAKVAAAMAAADITLPDVAAYLAARGWTVLPGSIPRAHWRAATPGAYPLAYYVCELRAAIGDTALSVYFPQTAGPWAMYVKAVDSRGASGNWSLVGWSDNGTGSNALPGVKP